MKLLVTSDTLTYTCRQNTNAHKIKINSVFNSKEKTQIFLSLH